MLSRPKFNNIENIVETVNIVIQSLCYMIEIIEIGLFFI